ncbi:hypothetical protein BDN72DRAFT_966294, partial [Pluteus cervinus]
MVRRLSKDSHTAQHQRTRKQIRKIQRRINQLENRLNGLNPIILFSLKQNPDDAAECKRINRRIRKLRRRLNQFKFRLNALALINHRLPPELLTQIFSLLQTDLQTAGAAYYRWTRITHVSRYWRNLAFGAKFLWSRVNYATAFPQSAWTEFSFEHSKPHGLDVVMKVTSVNPQFTLAQVILRDMSRMRTLQVTLDLGTKSSLRYLDDAGVQRLADLVRAFGEEAPFLEEISITGINLFARQGPHQNPTPTILFGSNAPRLTSIDIWNFHFHLTSMPFTNLTILKVRYARNTPGCLSFKTLFQVLLAN